ncbi:MAG: efflux RND transporter permease subunit, partial [Planctomycetes bacterium]|nr:efflux RND transporter permease subunit [Planctomycetota bacterium]
EVQLDRVKLAARGLTATDVVRAIGQNVGTIPSGRVREGATEYSVTFDADYDRFDQLEELEIANRRGRRIRLGDVGRVVMKMGELRQAARVDGRPCIAIKVIKKAEANAVRVARAVRHAVQRLNRELPRGMELIWVSDDGTFIEATNRSAWVNVIQGIVLTAAILFLFLYNVRTLLIVSITMPLTIIIGLFFMHAVGYSLNTSTLIAIGMSVGILVTNSIVVLEAIVKRFDETGDPKSAAQLGAREAFIAVLASAGTNVVVLFPLAVMKTLVGLFIAPLAMTMFIMTIVSLFISFTLTPMLASLLLTPHADGRNRSWLARLQTLWNRGFEAVLASYDGTLRLLERRRWAAALVLLVVFGLLVHAIRLGAELGTSAFAETDMGRILVRLEFPTRYNLAETVRQVERAERRLQDLPELQHILTMVGKVEAILGQSSEGVYLAQIVLKFSERDERELSIVELMDLARSRLHDFPDARIVVSQPAIIGGQANPIELEIAGEDLKTLDRLALQVEKRVRWMPGVLDPDTSVRPGKPEIRVRPRRAVLSDLKTPAAGLGLTLRGNLEGLTAGTFKQAARSYDIVVKLSEVPGKDQVRRFLLPGSEGRPVLLTSLSQIVEGQMPIQIVRKDKRRVAKLFAQLDEKTLPLGTAVERISRIIDEQIQLPPGYGYQFTGTYEFMAEGQEGLIEALGLSLILVFLTLAAILESFRQPVLILVTVPLALIGVVWALALAGGTFSIFVIMGFVMLVGIVVNNAILIMDQFNSYVRGEGLARHEAMILAARERFRPIVMITLAAVLGMLPLALGRGIGAELRNDVGIASVGGILVSGVLTLIVVPVLYDLGTRRSFGERSGEGD